MSTETTSKLSAANLLKAGGAAMLAAVIVNVVVRYILVALGLLSPDFQPISLGAIIFFTFAYTLVGVIVLAVVNRFAANPLKTYNMVGLGALVFSLIPNFSAAANPAAMPMGGTSGDYLTLIIFHVTAAAAFLGTLNFAARRR